MTRLTLARAKEILATPPTVIGEVWVENKKTGTLHGFQKLRHEYSGIEQMLYRTVVKASDTGWQFHPDFRVTEGRP